MRAHLLVFAALIGLAVLLRPPAPAQASTPTAAVAVHAEGEVLEVEGGFDAPVPIAVAWSVLTDYAHLRDFTPGLRESQVLSRADQDAVVRQEGAAQLLLGHLTIHLKLMVHEVPMREIAFHDISGQDFVLYEGRWSLQAVPGGVHVAYQLSAKPRASAPRFIEVHALQNNATAQLQAVRNEIIPRSSPAATPGAKP